MIPIPCYTSIHSRTCINSNNRTRSCDCIYGNRITEVVFACAGYFAAFSQTGLWVQVKKKWGRKEVLGMWKCEDVKMCRLFVGASGSEHLPSGSWKLLAQASSSPAAKGLPVNSPPDLPACDSNWKRPGNMYQKPRHNQNRSQNHSHLLLRQWWLFCIFTQTKEQWIKQH